MTHEPIKSEFQRGCFVRATHALARTISRNGPMRVVGYSRDGTGVRLQNGITYHRTFVANIARDTWECGGGI